MNEQLKLHEIQPRECKIFPGGDMPPTSPRFDILTPSPPAQNHLPTLLISIYGAQLDIGIVMMVTYV